MRDEDIDLVFKAIAHPERRRILTLLLARPGQSLFEICASSVGATGQSLTRQTVSQHLDALKKAQLIEIAWKGRTKTHSVSLVPLRAAIELISESYL